MDSDKGIFRLDGKVAAITGAGSGIGRAIARLFGRQGARVAVIDLQEPAAKETVAEMAAAGHGAAAFTCDIGDAGSVTATFEAIGGRLGGLDVLVNNAGISHVGNIERTSEDDFDRVLRVNAKGAFLATKAAVPLLLARGGGVILNISSLVAVTGIPDRLAYSMSKGALHSMTYALAADYMKKNIRCNAICSARIHTPFVDGFIKKNYPGREAEMFRKLTDDQPIGRMGKPEEMAALALYLCSDEASFISGAAFHLNGGVMAV